MLTLFWFELLICWNLWFFIFNKLSTVPTGPKLTADPRFALGPLRVRSWVRSGSALSPLGVRSEFALGEGSALRTHAWSGPRSVVTAYKPLVYSKHTVQPVHYVVAIRSIHTCRTVKRFHGEHQQNHQNFILYSAKNCYSEWTCSFTEVWKIQMIDIHFL